MGYKTQALLNLIKQYLCTSDKDDGFLELNCILFAMTCKLNTVQPPNCDTSELPQSLNYNTVV